MFFGRQKKCCDFLCLSFQINGADPNAKNIEEETALIMASFNGHLEMAKFLLQNGAEINVQNKNAETPLILAERYGHVQLENFLRENGAVNADPDLQEARGPKLVS